MKAINGNLNMSKKYKLITVEYGELAKGSGESCQNCGNLIANVAVVESEDGALHRIGLDCMNTIVYMLPSEKQEAKNRIARERKFYKYLTVECKCIVTAGGVNGWAWAYNKLMLQWDVFFKYRFVYSKWESVIKKLNIPVVIDYRE